MQKNGNTSNSSNHTPPSKNGGKSSQHVEHPEQTAMEATDTQGGQDAELKQQQKILKRIELKCLEMKEMMLAHSHPSDYIELRISRFRQMLLKKEGLTNHELANKDLLSPLSTHRYPIGSHSIASRVNTDDEPGKRKRKRERSSDDTHTAQIKKIDSLSPAASHSSPLKDRSNCKLNAGKNSAKRSCKNEKSVERKSSSHRSHSAASRSRSSSRGRHTSPSADRVRRSSSKDKHKNSGSPAHSPKSTKSNGSSQQKAEPNGTVDRSGRTHRTRTQDTPEAYSSTATARRRSYTRSASPQKHARTSRDKSRDRRSRSTSHGGERWSRSRSHESHHSHGSRYSASHSPSRSRSPSIRRRKGSPSHLDRRRITRADSRDSDKRQQGSRPNYPSSTGQRSRSRESRSTADQSRSRRRR